MSDFWSHLTANAAAAPNKIYAIDHMQVISVTGPDSSKFMQGQFSCNLSDVSEQQYVRGACCNAKGRMVASFNLAQKSEGYLLTLDASLAEPLLAHLKKYMVFFKCQMQITDYVLAGLTGPDTQSLIEQHFGSAPTNDFAQTTFENGLVIKLPFDAGYEIWLNKEHAENALTQLLEDPSKCSLTGNTAWQGNLISHGLCHMDHNNYEKLIPQMMNLDQTGGISFNKGCYTGQEIVARMQYLGKLKRHGYSLKISGIDTITTGEDIFAEGHKSPIGSVVAVSKLEGDEHLVFAVLDDKHLESTLSFGAEGEKSANAVEVLSLKYSTEIQD